MSGYPFVVRVYGLDIDIVKGVLVSDEFFKERFITKFPGGGLEFGEGLQDCLRREFMEETGHKIEIVRHYYTTDFFVPSAFDSSLQVISVYYLIQSKAGWALELSHRPFQFRNVEEGAQAFRRIPVEELSSENLTLPIDQYVGRMLKNDFGK
ncbi:MAG: NUDIX domain-containing protein [Bacteroidia bacterium]|nr:NUDIX domain-containing protein [Bacteroidia bacterium]